MKLVLEKHLCFASIANVDLDHTEFAIWYDPYNVITES